MHHTTPSIQVFAGDIFDVACDTLICSANVFLTLSGGVGGELLRRHGDKMQQPLNDHLARRGQRHVPQGSVVSVEGRETPWRNVLHAVCVDGMYDSTPKVVTQTLAKCWNLTAAHGNTHTALPALATGYGHLTLPEFGQGLIAALHMPNRPHQITIALPDPDHAAELKAQLRHAGLDV